jgi:hypothetical protein
MIKPASEDHASVKTEDTPVNNAVVAETAATNEHESRLTKLKTAFLYVLIAGLAAAAITSVIALLVGQFNSTIGKSLLTIFSLFIHSLLILAVLWADRYNQVGKLVLPTTIVVLVFANMITTVLGTWEIISSDVAWRALGLYFFILGAAFIIAGLLRLQIAHHITKIALYTAIGLIVATVLALVPWVLQIVDRFDPLYYRIIAALSILATTSFLIAIVIRGIAVGKDEALKLTAPKPTPHSGGMLAIYISIGVITGFVWLSGLTAFLVSGVQSTSPYQPSRYNDRIRNY